MKDLDDELMRSIYVDLNTRNGALKNWRDLGKALGVPRDILDAFKPDEPHSATRVLFEWIFFNKCELTVGEMCRAFKKIVRNDIVKLVREHLHYLDNKGENKQLS